MRHPHSIANKQEKPSSLRLLTLFFSLMLFGWSGCLSFKPVIVAPKTELEIQIVGHFERLERELPLYAPASAPTAMPPARRALMQAMLDRTYLEAELQSLRERGIVAEVASGRLALDRNRARREGVDSKQIAPLVDSENDARERIARGIVATEKGLQQKDLPLVRRLLGERIAKRQAKVSP